MTTSGAPTQTISVMGPMTIWQVGAHRLGVAVLEESFKWAAFGLCGATTSRRHVLRVNEALSFIRGTALEVHLETFGIELQAEQLREAFDTWLNQQKRPYYP